MRLILGFTLLFALLGCASEELYNGVAPIGQVVSVSPPTNVLRGDRLMALGPKSYLYAGDAIMTGAADTFDSGSVIVLSDKSRFEVSQQTQLDLVQLDQATKSARLVLSKGRVVMNTGKLGRAQTPGYTIVTRMGTVTVHQGQLVLQYHPETDVLEVELVKGKPVVIRNAFGRGELVEPSSRLSVRFGAAPEEPELRSSNDA